MEMKLISKVWLFLLSLGFSQSLQSQSPAKLKVDTVEYRELMTRISRQLGVTCTACHNTNNFQDDSKKEFLVARQHMRIVQSLIDAGFNGQKGQPLADCYMCHRGELSPKYKEPLDPITHQQSGKSKYNPFQPNEIMSSPSLTPKDSPENLDPE